MRTRGVLVLRVPPAIRSAGDCTYGTLADPEFLGEFPEGPRIQLVDASAVAAPDLSSDFLGDQYPSTSLPHVSHVVLMRSEIEMAQVDAKPVVAGMENMACSGMLEEVRPDDPGCPVVTISSPHFRAEPAGSPVFDTSIGFSVSGLEHCIPGPHSADRNWTLK